MFLSQATERIRDRGDLGEYGVVTRVVHDFPTARLDGFGEERLAARKTRAV
ncbi:MAG: hypothetical protein V3R72_06965 [Gammaproteobacteria bacterium]